MVMQRIGHDAVAVQRELAPRAATSAISALYAMAASAMRALEARILEANARDMAKRPRPRVSAMRRSTDCKLDAPRIEAMAKGARGNRRAATIRLAP
jgi:gamma-glutamyl phosphate reductase